VTQHSWTINTFPWLEGADGRPGPRVRVIIDNDFSGDPDDLYQVVHHVLSPSVEIRALICSHLSPGDPTDPGPNTAAHAVDRLRELFDVMGLDADGLIHQGSDDALVDRTAPYDTPAARAIIAEAMRDDDRPLYVACGGGLTDLASAWLLEPAIAGRLTVIWIGGPEHPGLASPWPEIGDPEYNLAIDVTAAQVVFNDSDLPLWVVPRDMYRQCLVSDMELRRRVATRGKFGRFLFDALQDVARGTWSKGARLGETYALGDSPLVLLTALQSLFEADASSTDFAEVPAPALDERGALVPRPGGRPIRVFTRIDTRLMFEDLFLKLEAFAEWRES
jgi:purine nucleosidase